MAPPVGGQIWSVLAAFALGVATVMLLVAIQQRLSPTAAALSLSTIELAGRLRVRLGGSSRGRRGAQGASTADYLQAREGASLQSLRKPILADGV
jgi:hypothetical protein